MLQAGIQAIWLALYHYYVEQAGEIEKGRAKRIAVCAITFGTLLAVHLPVPGWGGPLHEIAGWLVIAGVFFLYDLFYDGKPLGRQWWKVLAPGIIMAGCVLAEDAVELVLCTGAVTVSLLLLLGCERGHLGVWNGLLNLAVYVLLGCLCVLGRPIREGEAAGPPGVEEASGAIREGEAAGPPGAEEASGVFREGEAAGPPGVEEASGAFREGEAAGPPGVEEASGVLRAGEGVWRLQSGGIAEAGFLAGILGVELLLFFSLEGTLFSWQRGYEAQTERFQREVLGHQYEEIREIYLNMRGWRHDYHNHLQVMKAQLALGQTEEMGRYLDDLEQSLDSVDTYVKSGNLMVDAILNSKLTLASQREIRVNCKAVLPGELSVEDVDLCVLLGNLLDNALEACEKIPPDQRFLRIYMTVNRAQLYVSVQNSAREDLSFDERNYISQKRGSHGLGMKRVKALTDKYEGYLTLANEPGIFAAELTLPCI